jgi:pyrimidine-nucleoside phosphorylase
LTREEFIHQLATIGLVLTGQSLDLAPADGKLYALRDVTGTVQSIPLIASSVMSKKIAAGAQAIVLDVKVGVGAFMRTLDEARQLAHLMVSIGALSDRKVVALISDMNQPLGVAVGNALETREAIDTLHGSGPRDFCEHCLIVASHMLLLGRHADTLEEGRRMAEWSLSTGKAWEKFRSLVAAQGGDLRYIDNPDLLPCATMVQTVTAPRSGYLVGINAREVGETAVDLGAGRAQKGDLIDPAVGILVKQKVGNHVEEGDVLFRIHANVAEKIAPASQRLTEACAWSDKPCQPLPLIYDVIK